MSNEPVPRPNNRKHPRMAPAARRKPAARPKLSFFESVSDQDKIDFARHLAIIIKAGIPLYDGLLVVKKQSQSPGLVKIMNQLSQDVSNGVSSLIAWSTIKKYSEIFSSVSSGWARRAARFRRTCAIFPTRSRNGGT